MFKRSHLLLTAAILSLSIVFYFTNCTREYIENINPVCFESEVLPIFQSSCLQSGCHNSTDKEDGYDLSSYESIVKKGIVPGDYRNSELYRVLIRYSEAMPPKPYKKLPDAQITTIALWIEQGAMNTTNCAPAACDTSNVTFSGSVKPIMDTYCNGCHATSAPSGSIILDTYDGVKPTVTSGSLLGSVEHVSGYSPMPQGGNKLSDCAINTIKKWIELGAPNN